MMRLNVIYFSITVRQALSYAVEKVESMLEVADVLKSSGKELLALVPKDSKFRDVSNKIQNAIYWVIASLKSLCPFNGHAAEMPVSDFDIPQFGEPGFIQQQQQEQQQQEPTSTKCHVPAAAAGSSEQEATDVLIVDDPEIPDPKHHKKFQKVCQTHVTREQICTKITIVILLTLRIPDTIQKEVHQQDLFLMTQCVTVVNHLIVQGKLLNMCHNNILQTLFRHVLFVAQHQPKGNTSGSMLGHSI